MLPTLNSINYTLTIPSTGKKVQYRPYLVKEEKIMMLALESADPKLMLNTIANTIESCLIDFTGSVRDLCTFDIEYMFLQIRSKSVGESIDVQLSCQTENCKGKKEHTIQFDKVEPPKVVKNKKSNIIKITDEVSLMMRYPSYQNLMNYSEIAETDSKSEQAINTMFSAIIACIEYIIINDEEKIDVSEYSLDDMRAFLDQFTSSQFNLLKEFVANIPELKHSIKWACNDCGNENELTLKGTNDFFQ